MKEKLLKYSIYTAGLISLFVFSTIRITNSELFFGDPKNVQYGDLALETMVDNFMVELPSFYRPKLGIRSYRDSEHHPKFNNADIFTFGDSFFYIPRGNASFPEQLSNKINKKVFFEHAYNGKNPFHYFKGNNYVKGEKKYLVYEIVERNIPNVLNNPIHTLENENVVLNSEKKSFPIKFYNYDAAEKRYQYFFVMSKWTNKLVRFINTFRFNNFGFLTEKIPLYSTKEKILFFKPTVEIPKTKASFSYIHSKNDIEIYANTIIKIKDDLKRLYNIELIFMPIPNKISIYNKKVSSEPYGNLLPRLISKLNSKNVKIVDLYPLFKNNKKELYYGTDTHWNQDGINLALNALLPQLK